MRFISEILLLAWLTAAFACAQTPTFKNIIVIVQENRSPDNLFQDPALIASGANIQSYGVYKDINGHQQQVSLTNRPLSDCIDPDHTHAAWENMYDAGAMDQADKIHIGVKPPCALPIFPNFTYVNSSDVSPYFQIAENYGFANYMFATNEGPSFPAHQFLLSGTSAPATSSALFAAENPVKGFQDAGCTANNGETVAEINNYGSEIGIAYPCFEHPTLTDVIESHPPLTWRYYAWTNKSIWTAPNAIEHICGGIFQGGTCPRGSDYATHVVIDGNQIPTSHILSDIQTCNLQNVSWVIPNGKWSDHALNNDGSGPDWVADIVNAIGNSKTNGDPCNYWDDPNHNTAILITWDDWGGYYDHVQPWEVVTLGTTNWGAGYVSGFRVPLLVVSAHSPAYISGAVSGGPLPTACPILTSPQYCHDFGSILGFIEKNFSIPVGSINPSAPYADGNAPDLPNPLSDFFTPSTRSFVPIVLKNPQHDANYFINYTGPILDPDNDGDD